MLVKTPLIVSDTDPLITFLKIHKLELLEIMYGEVRIPPAVDKELTKNKKFPLEKLQIDNSPFIQVDTDFDASIAARLQKGIHQGESEAIALVLTLNKNANETIAALMVDDKDAKAYAKQEGLIAIGAIGILKEAFEQELLTEDEIMESIVVMKATHRYYSEEDYEVLLDAIRKRKDTLDISSEAEDSPDDIVSNGLEEYRKANNKRTLEK